MIRGTKKEILFMYFEDGLKSRSSEEDERKNNMKNESEIMMTRF